MHGSLGRRIKLPFLEITKHALCQKNCAILIVDPGQGLPGEVLLTQGH